MRLVVETETLRLAEPFRISGYVFETADVLVATLQDGEHRGRGEASGVYYLGDDLNHMQGAIETARPAIEAGLSREELRAAMPPGGARNAVDAALWELEAARAGKPVWTLAGLPEPRPIVTTFTVGADTPEAMAAKAVSYAQARSIKVKLTGDLELDLARVAAIRAARPDVWLGVDGNQGFARTDLEALTAALVEHGVALLEQPLPRGAEAELEGFRSPVPIAGDESLVSLTDVAGAVGRFDVVNIKLDKCGGLTEGLLMASAARDLGLGVMVGTMVGTSLATAPGFVLGQVADLVDLDGPTFLAQDRAPSVVYADGTLFAGPEVWGSGAA
ncbi:dipeptide epimerase [Novosphingobium guangzhouense]|uniref:Dipeptide epimerase n=1 Tax=Novosphingobium guangzhouense TaxID=1850347 RepID=A0A2K2G3U3_9SPHN|nr:dipeptide epimerase [Novosphingobium guangzhouense]PNU05697.1 dipeptide epimerase [Novosphingobium guangzhouense]